MLNIIERATKNKSSKQSHGNNACQAPQIKGKLKLTGNQSKATWLKTRNVLIRGNKSEQMKQNHQSEDKLLLPASQTKQSEEGKSASEKTKQVQLSQAKCLPYHSKAKQRKANLAGLT